MQYWCLIQLFILIIFITESLTNSASRRNINKKLLEDMKSIMNEKADPCTDFYQYACGHWDYELPYHREYKHIVGSLEYKINIKLKQVLEQRMWQTQQETNVIYSKVRLYYESCKKQNSFNVTEYLEILKPSDRDEWPKEGEYWQPNGNWNVWLTLARLQTVGLNDFLLTMNMKRHNSTHFYIYLNKMENLNYSAYEQRILDDVDYMYDMEAYLIYKKVENFLHKLFLLNRKHQKNSNIFQEMTATELQRLVKNIDFKTYFTTLWGQLSLEDLPLKVAHVDYLKDLGDLLNETENSILIHALKLRFLGFMEKEMPRSTNEHLNCVQHLRDLVPLALDYIYEKEFYQPLKNNSNRFINKLFKNVKDTFFTLIAQHSKELSLEEYNFLKAKLKNMKLNIGNMPLLANQSFYEDYFYTWQVHKNLFYWNHINALQHFYTERFNLLQQPWFEQLHTYFPWPFATPAYQPTTNLLIIPYAYLQYPIFHPEFHQLFLYAELGNTLGHEMLHAFDINGLQYDSLGNPSSVFMKSLPDKKSLMASLECFEKFKSFSLNEIIADISGFRLAYDVYFQRKRVHKFRGTTQFSNKQLFFIKFAQFFCSSYSYHDETHDSPSYRVRKVVTSHPEFEKIFKCQKNIYKREVEKCNLW